MSWKNWDVNGEGVLERANMSKHSATSPVKEGAWR